MTYFLKKNNPEKLNNNPYKIKTFKIWNLTICIVI